jgi:valine--pyruvate aminotransferase
MCVSCPTNPTGNVLTQNEFDSLHALCRRPWHPAHHRQRLRPSLPRRHSQRFPAEVAARHDLQHQHEQGRPARRAHRHDRRRSAIVKALSNMNAITSLANGNLGQAILTPLLADDTLIKLGPRHHPPVLSRTLRLRQKHPHRRPRRPRPMGAARAGRRLLPLALDQRPAHSRQAELYRRLKERKGPRHPRPLLRLRHRPGVATPARMPAPHLLAAAAHRAEGLEIIADPHRRRARRFRHLRHAFSHSWSRHCRLAQI